MKKTEWGQTILELHDIADLPIVSRNAEIVEKKVGELISKIELGQVESFDEVVQELEKLKTDMLSEIGLLKQQTQQLQEDKLDRLMKDEKNKQTYTIVFKNGELYKREVL